MRAARAIWTWSWRCSLMGLYSPPLRSAYPVGQPGVVRKVYRQLRREGGVDGSVGERREALVAQ